MTALGAGEDRGQDDIAHGFTDTTVDGNPAFLVALVRASTFTLALSNTTVVSRLGRLDLTSMTPSIRVNANLTVIGQVGQFIPGTERTALCWAAQLGPMSREVAPVF